MISRVSFNTVYPAVPGAHASPMRLTSAMNRGLEMGRQPDIEPAGIAGVET